VGWPPPPHLLTPLRLPFPPPPRPARQIKDETARSKEAAKEAREQAKREREHEQTWEKTRDDRVTTWRDFQKNKGAGTKAPGEAFRALAGGCSGRRVSMVQHAWRGAAES
jgi:hypothetical protein